MRKNYEGVYVTQDTFNSLCTNTTELINVLNHRMTKLEADVCWIKKIMGVQTSILSGMFLALLGIVFKLLIS